MSIEISAIYIKERWKDIVMEQIKNIYNPSKIQISSDKCQGKFLWTGIQRLEGKRNDSVWLIQMIMLGRKRKQGQFKLTFPCSETQNIFDA